MRLDESSRWLQKTGLYSEELREGKSRCKVITGMISEAYVHSSESKGYCSWVLTLRWVRDLKRVALFFRHLWKRGEI